jgi:predicted DCC family thiol-disulfide oxidoreductase YuxK
MTTQERSILTNGFSELNKDKTIFFDSYCVLCNRFLNWVIQNDPEKKIFICPLDSILAQKLKKYFPELKGIDSVLYFDGERAFSRGKAVRKIVQDLKLTSDTLKLVVDIIPSPVLGLGYDLVAANRYKIFGKYDICPPLPKEWRERMKV